ncbi:hypothetical protein NBRC116188_22840 [Oceaniserpentilla sp. 4NH20-0058]|uniref:SPOR domain-containing protein n=1 Tax=Oceaniserpentilla sp. 4NH20-0058 TaxID=3127660 RepID=UPI003105B565
MTGKDISSPDIIMLGERAQQLDMLLHVQEFSAMSVLITGPQEIGKTTLLKAASDQLSVHHQVIMLDALNIQQLPDIIDLISMQVGCDANLIDLDSRLVAMAAEGESVHVLIDDAHLLSDDLLSFFLDKSTLDHGWRLILCGDESLKSRLDELQPQFENKLYHLIELSPLTEEESEVFITQVFKRSGIDVIPISMKDMHQLWILSKGVPGQLLGLIELEQESQTQKDASFPIGHIAAVLLIGSALLVSVLYQTSSDEAALTDEDAIAALVVKKQLEKQQKPEPATLALQPEELNAQAPSMVTNPQLDVVKDTSSEQKATIEREQSELTPQGQPVEKPMEARQVAQSKPSPAPQEMKAAKIEHPIMNMSGKSFALQLLGVRSEENAKSFVKRFSRQIGSDNLNIYQTRYRGEPWFVVVYGPINNKQLASEQAQKLSKTIKSQPWVRPISKIQDDIRDIPQQ